MCRICNKIKKIKVKDGVLNDSIIQDLLEIIANMMKNGNNNEHLQKIMDDILETSLPDRNLELEEAWEKENRKDG